MPQLLFTLFISCTLLAQVSVAQSSDFEGVIKYVSPDGLPGDSIIMYFGKQKMRISRMGSFVEKTGGQTDEITNFQHAPNTTILYYAGKGEVQSVESKTSGIDSIVTYPDSVRMILGHTCTKAVRYYREHEAFGSSFRIVETIWLAKDLRFSVPEAALSSPFHPDNSPCGIPLLSQRTVYAALTNGENTVSTSTLVACEITAKELPDSVFIVP